jgi:dihydroflavonol-4-reductase
MRVALTGSTGFLGRHIVDRLHGAHDLVCISRSGTAPPDCTAKAIDVVRGRGLKAAFAKADVVVHAAGLVSHEPCRAEETLDVHLKGTQNVLEAARSAKVRRVVLLSTSGTIAVSTQPDAMATEADPAPDALISAWPYYRSKRYAEQLAMGFEGLDIVSLNPSLLLGPGDVSGGVSTSAVSVFLDEGVPIAPSGGISFVDVRDVAMMVEAALTQGTPGERYLLASGNMPFIDFYARLARITGRDAPVMAMPRLTRRALGWFPSWGRQRGIGIGLGPAISRAELELSSHYWYASSAKAEAELGFVPRDPLTTLEDTVGDILERQGRAAARFR